MPTAERVQERLKSLPKKPGCYIYRDGDGDVLYVGKAIDLRSRVRSYFQKKVVLDARKSRTGAPSCSLA